MPRTSSSSSSAAETIPYTCYDCGEAFVYNSGARAANAPVKCGGCDAPFCPNCAFDTMCAFKDAVQRRGVTQRQVNEASLRRTDRSDRRVEIVLSECRYCTRNKDLAEPDHANLLDYALLKLGMSFEDLHAEYLRITDTEHALASSFEHDQRKSPAKRRHAPTDDDDDDVRKRTSDGHARERAGEDDT